MNINLNQKMTGVITALGTPLDEKNNLHKEGMRLQVEAQIEGGVNGLLCLGSMGMAQMQTPEVREQAIKVTMETAAGRVPVLVGCGDCSTERTLQYMKVAEYYRVDGVVLITPYFPRLSDDELFEYFATLASLSTVPLYLYDVPYYTKLPLSFNLIQKLAAHTDKIAGIKASGDLTTFRTCVTHFENDAHFSVLSGHTNFLDQAIIMGADGIVDGLFAIAPRIAVNLYEAARNLDVKKAEAEHRKLMMIRDILGIESIFGAFTYIMNAIGIPGNFCCHPIKKLTSAGEKQVQLQLDKIREQLPLLWQQG